MTESINEATQTENKQGMRGWMLSSPATAARFWLEQTCDLLGGRLNVPQPTQLN